MKIKKARSYHSKILQDFIDMVDSRPDHKERLHGTHLMMDWNILLFNETVAMMSGAMEGEMDEIQTDFQPLFYDEIEEFRGGIKICG